MDTWDLPPVSEKTSAASTKEMVLISLNLPGVLAPSLLAVGFQRAEDLYLIREQDSVEFSHDKDGRWWMIIVLDGKLRSESIVDGITQALRLLWTFDVIAVAPPRDSTDVAA